MARLKTHLGKQEIDRRLLLKAKDKAAGQGMKLTVIMRALLALYLEDRVAISQPEGPRATVVSPAE